MRCLGGGPPEVKEIVRPQGNDQVPGPELWDPVIGGVNEPGLRYVPQVIERAKQCRPVFAEAFARQPSNVLQHHCPRLSVFNDSQGSREKISLVIWSQLLAGERKRRAGNTAGDKIYPAVIASVQTRNVGSILRALEDIPSGPVAPERCTRILVYLSERDMLQASLL